MKKLTLSIAIVLLTLTSCTTPDQPTTENNQGQTSTGFLKGKIETNSFGSYGTQTNINNIVGVTNIVATVSESRDKILLFDNLLIQAVGSNEIVSGTVSKFTDTDFRIYNFNGTNKIISFTYVGAYNIQVIKNFNISGEEVLFTRSGLYNKFYGYE
jgi:hypothetical protein